ncbi:MAG: SGNH/GDSL hydrolase family protein [bacterium]|nr:SGNH/GDSL hydrolase family protein [bacterium]
MSDRSHSQNSLLRLRILSVVISLAIIFLMMEVAIRLVGDCDKDRNFFVLGRRLHPFRLPVVSTQETLDHYLGSTEMTVAYDPQLGWAPRPAGVSVGGLHRNNDQGIRAEKEFSREQQADRYRIALFGDSFTYGYEVRLEESWGFLLEQELNARQKSVEVLNFGVGGYGMDQALLRWMEVGRNFEPHLVLFGLQAENVKRNLNLFRPLLYYGDQIPLFKPRFVLEDNGLRLVNQPSLPPEEVVANLNNVESWRYANYEYFYGPDDYRDSLWQNSRLAALAVSAVTQNRFSRRRRSDEFYGSKSAPARLAVRILKEFRLDVEEQGGRFEIVHLPTEVSLRRVLGGKPLEYQDLLGAAAKVAPVIDPLPSLLQASRATTPDSLFEEWHYSSEGNRVIAGSVAEALSRESAWQATRD